MPAATTGADLPALVVACGTAVSAVIGAALMRRARKPDNTGGGSTGESAWPDPEDRPARLRERLSAVEARVDTLEADKAEDRAAHAAMAATLAPARRRQRT